MCFVPKGIAGDGLSRLQATSAEWAGVDPPLPPWPEDPLPAILKTGEERSVLVLDDDPTGTQTLRDVDVLLGWDAESAAALLDTPHGFAYVITNSRAATGEAAADIARRIGADVGAFPGGSGHVSVVSRSDSTLRGHFPAEVDALTGGLAIPGARIVLAPYFGDGGRVTIDDVHYLRVGDALVPVAETDFAADPTFGYRNSNLRDWVAERAGPDRPVASLSLDDLRRHGPGAARDAIARLPEGGVLIANAVVDRDIEVLVQGALEAEIAGTRLVARSAATFVRARIGESRHGLLAQEDLATKGPGLVVVGSFVPAAGRQLDRLRARHPRELRSIEVDAAAAAGGPLDPAELKRLGQAVDGALRAGQHVVLWTSRSVRLASSGDAARAAGQHVSNAVVEVVRRVEVRPSWVIAKGGITSHDVARFGLDMRRVRVLGQVAAGVPVWRAGDESRWPGLLYVVVPGNVGDDDSLRSIVSIFEGERGGARWS
jgi:uncharacterized protein YgbK (DUF1537 family)